MVYGAEAVLPHDLKFGAPRISGYEEEEVEEALQDDKDTTDEARDNHRKVRWVPGQAAHIPKQPPAHQNFQQRRPRPAANTIKSTQACPIMGRTVHSLGSHRRGRL